MLKFFFNRFSKVVYWTEVAGLLLFAIAAVLIVIRGASSTSIIFFIITVLEYAFLKICAIKRWYKNAPRCSGIELQFKKSMVPTSYIMAIFGVLFLVTRSATPLIFTAISLALIGHVNVILLYLHFHDKSETPVNFLTGNRP